MLSQRTSVSTGQRSISSRDEQKRRCNDTLYRERDHTVEGMCTLANGPDCGDCMDVSDETPRLDQDTLTCTRRTENTDHSETTCLH